MERRGRHLSPEDELLHSLWTSTFDVVGYFLLICVCVSLFSAFLCGLEPLQIPKDNFPNISRAMYLEMKIRDKAEFFIGEDGTNHSFQWEEHLRNKIKHRQGMVRVNFGTAWTAWCFPGAPADHSTLLLPSILRVMELKAMTQVLIRLIPLGCMCTRSLGSWFRVCKFRNLNRSLNGFWRSFSLVTPIVMFIETLFAFLSSSLHQDCDEELKFLMPWAVLGLGIFSSLFILLNITMDILDRSSDCIRTFRFPFRILCLCLTILIFPRIVVNFIPFLERKLCHPYVPWTEASLEYICLFVLISFNVTTIFDFPNIQFSVTVTEDELQADSLASRDIFCPKYLHEMERKVVSDEEKGEYQEIIFR